MHKEKGIGHSVFRGEDFFVRDAAVDVAVTSEEDNALFRLRLAVGAEILVRDEDDLILGSTIFTAFAEVQTISLSAFTSAEEFT